MLKKVLMAGSALCVATMLSMGVSNAQDQSVQPEKKMERTGDNDCLNNEDCAPGGGKSGKNRADTKIQDEQMGDNAQDQGTSRARKKQRAAAETCENGDANCADASGKKRNQANTRDDDDNVDKGERRKEARRDWSYDPQRHKRSRNKDATFRFYFGGYYYPEAYWDGPVVVLSNRGRVSCREGRRIVDDSGFNRVRTVECSGRNYTYLGRRHGDTFRVVLNSRTGRIVSAREL